MSASTLRVAIILMLAVAGMVNSASAQSIVCRMKYIAGLQEEAVAAEKLIGQSSSLASELKLVLVAKNDMLYVHSNYTTEGFENPTKMTLTDKVSLDTIVLNVIASYSNPDVEDQLKAALGGMLIYADRSVRSSDFRYLINEAPSDRSFDIELTRPDVPPTRIPALEQSGVYIVELPNECRVGKSFIAKVHVAHDSAELESGNNNVRKVSLASLGIAGHDFIRVRCICPADCISLTPVLDDSKQKLGATGETLWLFDAKPLQSGDHEVQICLEVVDAHGKAHYRTLDTIAVSVAPDRTAFWRENWQYLLSTLMLPAAGVVWLWWKRRKKVLEEIEAKRPKIIVDT